MPAKSISFGELHFASKGGAEQYLMDMLHRYDVGDRVNQDDSIVLRAALALHPEAREKTGSGVSHFSVRSAEFGTKCFWLNRSDGTTEKFSFRRCIYG